MTVNRGTARESVRAKYSSKTCATKIDADGRNPDIDETDNGLVLLTLGTKAPSDLVIAIGSTVATTCGGSGGGSGSGTPNCSDKNVECESLLANPSVPQGGNVTPGQTLTIVAMDEKAFPTPVQATAKLENGTALTVTATATSGQPANYVNPQRGSAGNRYQVKLSFQLPANLSNGAHTITVVVYDGEGDVDFWNWNVNVVTPTPDTTKPTIIPTANKADGSAYTAGTWTNQNVTVSFSCVDNAGGSGVAQDTVPDVTVTATTTLVTSTGVCKDNAGNVADAASFGPIKIDKTKPVLSVAAKKADNSAYTAGTWTTQTVTVVFTCTDESGGSSVLLDTVPDVTVNTSVASVPSTGSCQDAAGNVADGVSFGAVKVDGVKPTITATAKKADGSAYTAGSWTNQNVTVVFTCADNAGGSGIAQDTVPDVTVTATTTLVTSTGTCKDSVGNVADAASFGPIKIDKIKPVITVTAKTLTGATYVAGTTTTSRVKLTYTCTDENGGSSILLDTVPDKYATVSHTTVTSSGTCQDAAGNVADPVTFGPIKISKSNHSDDNDDDCDRS